jgi:hypothetical protein
MSGMIVIPASLRSDFIHMAGMTIHIALESTIHIVGIRNRPIDSGWHPPRETDPPHFLLCRYLIPEDLISPLGRDDTSSM